MANVTEEDIILMGQQTAGLSREEKYLVQQYTHHGDVIMNAFLRGSDDFNTYKMNVYNPEMDQGEQRAFFCLFLLELDPNALSDPTHFEGGNIKYYGGDLLFDKNFMRYYTNTIYPQFGFNTRTYKSLMNFFRDMTASVIQKLGVILAKRPSFSKIFITYRGSESKYLADSDEALTLGSFHSTSIDVSLAEKFGRFLYKFCVYPGCIYMYVEPLTIHHGEKEVLLGPGNRYIAIPKSVRKQIRESNDLFIILPPKYDDARNKRIVNKAVGKLLTEDAAAAAAASGAAGGGGGGGGGVVAVMQNENPKEATVNNILTMLKKNTAHDKMLEDFYGAAAAKERRGGTRKLKRKSSDRHRRRRQTRKQRGGDKLHLNPMSRWAVDPMFVRMDELSEDDLEKVAEILAMLKEENRRK
jgi:hypothetical protein